MPELMEVKRNPNAANDDKESSEDEEEEEENEENEQDGTTDGEPLSYAIELKVVIVKMKRKKKCESQ